MSFVMLEKQGPIAILRFNRPEMMNAVGEAGDGAAVERACAEIADDLAIRCMILTGEGTSFSAGGNVKAMQDRTGHFAGASVDIRETYRGNIHRATRALYAINVPMIAAVNGPAIGLGCDLACLADIRIASEKARFGATFLKLGLVPGDGGAWILQRAIGMSRAAEMLFTADVITAHQAEAIGLVSRVVPHDRLMEEAMTVARKIAEQPAQALRLTKMMLRQGQTSTYDAALELAGSTQSIMHHTLDHEEGVAALLERRTPNFSGS